MVETVVFDGKKFADSVLVDIKSYLDSLADSVIVPGLAVVLVGDNPASAIYVNKKIKLANKIGIKSVKKTLPSNVSQKKVLDVIQELNSDDTVSGILLQLPLPENLDQYLIINTIAPNKDVDGLNFANIGKLALYKNSDDYIGIPPCTALACMKILHYNVSNLSGLNALVIGRSILVGKPVASMLLASNCTVTIAHSHTSNLPELCGKADIIVAAVGIAKFVKKNWIKEGAIILDVGINRTVDNKVVGDVDDVIGKASFITPVPKGIGPMTVACLMENTIKCYKKSIL